MSSLYPHLFAPLKIGKHTARNRIVMLPMGLKFSNDGTPGERDVAFYTQRAKGGVGIIITGGTVVHEGSVIHGGRMLEAFRSRNIPAFDAIAKSVHAHGSLILGQLFHCGREALGESDYPLIAPSALRSPATPRTPRRMSLPDIDEVVMGFSTSANNLMSAGYDGVEIHAAHGYLVGQFLSAQANERTDEYGGSVLKRTKFLLDILRQVRESIGQDQILGVRLSINEDTEDGLGLKEASEIAQVVETHGIIDYLSIAIGTFGNYVKDMSYPAAIGEKAAQTIRAVTEIPIVASQRITHPAHAEDVLVQGHADLIGMARALIADSQWVLRARSGLVDRIVPCIGCLQDCRAATDGVGCVHNPISGRETRLPRIRSAQHAKRIMIVGGGPAGLEAARIASERGHKVGLYERMTELGGQARIAANAPNRSELDGVISFRRAELDRLGVSVNLGVCVTRDLIADEQPDTVVVATGLEVGEPPFAVDPNAVTTNVFELLDPLQPSIDMTGINTAVVVDDDDAAFWHSISAAEFLSELGIRVRLITKARDPVANLPFESRGPALRRLRRRGVVFHCMTAVASVEADHVLVYDPVRMKAKLMLEETRLDAGLVVFCGPTRGNDSLFESIRSFQSEVHAAGDCLTPRLISHAVRDGFNVAIGL